MAERFKGIKLTKLFVAYVIILSSSIAILITGFQLFTDYERELDQLEFELNQIEDSYREIISKSVWNLDEAYLDLLSKSILRLPSVSHLKILDDSGETLTEVGTLPSRALTKTFSLTTKSFEKTYSLGQFTLTSNIDHIYETLWDRLLVILVTNIIKTFLVSILIYLFIKKYLIQHLERISEFLTESKKPGKSKPLVFKNNMIISSIHELEIVKDDINSMLESLNRIITSTQDKNVELSHTLTKKEQDIEEGYRWKTALLRVICHDLAQPITIVNLSCSYLQRNMTFQNDKERKSIEKIIKGAVTAQTIVRQIRELEAVASNKIELELEPCLIDELIEATIFLYNDRLKEKDIELILVLEPNLTALINPESFKQQVMANLLSNAIKFTSPGSRILIQSKCTDNSVTVAVKDEGIGMPEDLVKKIFNPAIKTSRAGTLGETGTGFGMPLVKTFVEKMNGSITVKSRPIEYGNGHGTTFTIKLQRAEPLPESKRHEKRA